MTDEKQSASLKRNEHWIGKTVSGIILDPDHTALIDTELLGPLLKFKWRAVKSNRCWYAKTTVGKGDKQFDLSMHRMVARTPRTKICHHRNRNSLNNRFCNLINLFRREHQLIHLNNSILIKFDPNYSEKPADTQNRDSARSEISPQTSCSIELDITEKEVESNSLSTI